MDEEKANTIRELYPDGDIYVIQECRRTDIYNFKDEWKFKNWYGDDQEIKSDLGIAIFSKNYKIEFPNVFNRNFRYVVPYKVTGNKKSITLFIVWTKPGIPDYDKNVIQAACSPECKDILNEAIIIGDFNTGYIEEYQERYTSLCKGLIGFKNCASGKPEEFMKTFYSVNKKKMYLNDFCFVSKNLFSSEKKSPTLSPCDILTII